jgi:hypothetical protein
MKPSARPPGGRGVRAPGQCGGMPGGQGPAARSNGVAGVSPLATNGRGGAPGQERATPPFSIERLLEGTLLTHLRSIRAAVFEPGNQGERPLRRGRYQVGAGKGLVTAPLCPAARRPPHGDNCDSDAHSPHDPCHATMVRNSHLIDKNFVEIR